MKVKLIERNHLGTASIKCPDCGKIVREETKNISYKTPYCGNCSKRIEDGTHNYCGHCGDRLDWS
jgi:predicted RNA-binding Zn-ribbon protein involved in translation (DUF1610 family)